MSWTTAEERICWFCFRLFLYTPFLYTPDQDNDHLCTCKAARESDSLTPSEWLSLYHRKVAAL